MTKAIEILRAEMPNFHGSDDEPKNWKSQWEILDFLQQRLKPDVRSLETGCGYSTVVAAESGADHVTVTPSADEQVRVRSFCNKYDIDHANVTFAIGPSCEMLPKLDGELHLVYIDGAHGFPHPCVDWMYTEARLAIGGTMLVDDIRIPSCRMLHEFLMEEPNWTLDRFIGDTSIFTKLAHGNNSADWMHQGINRTYPDFRYLPKAQQWKRDARHAAEWVARATGLTKPIKRVLGIK
ncbi:class I SAM-dependent methyltransferase [Sphingomonas sp.]|uniref:class I SAM-dependent methyltransferase n=1 Tax=Sphingomonas sp. TaxID=28214 RepID=UPI0025EAE436|nr:class I SAM-dependent methyltransferase [Sphingomonas sp.]